MDIIDYSYFLNYILERALAWSSEASLRISAAAIIFLVGSLAIKSFGKILQRSLKRFSGARAMAANFIASVLIKASWACLMLAILGKLGVDIAPLIAGLGVTGFVLGFAFQESLGSLASGLMIALNQPFKVGDYVAVGGFEGKVLMLDMMAVVLATSDNRRITIPNKSAWGSAIVNYSVLEMRRVDIAVGVAYGCDLSAAKTVARDAIAEVEGVILDPPPVAEVKSLDGSAVTLTVRAWAKNSNYWKVYFSSVQAIKEAFDRAGIEIPFPQVDVNLRRNIGA